MAINFQYQNPTLPLALGGYMDAKKIAYNQGVAGDLQGALNQQRANQAAGAQQFSNQMYGMATMAIQQEATKQRDAQQYIQARGLADQQSQNAANLYRTRYAVEAGYQDWGQLESAAQAQGKSVADFVPMQNLNQDIARAQALAPIQAQLTMQQEMARQQAQQIAGHNEQAFQYASPAEKNGIRQIEQKITDLNNPQSVYATRFTPFERERQLSAAMQERDRSYATLTARVPTTLKERVDGGTDVYYDDNGRLWTADANGRPQLETRDRPLSTMQRMNIDIAKLPVGSPAWVQKQTEKATAIKAEVEMAKVAQGIALDEPVDVTYDNDGGIASVKKVKESSSIDPVHLATTNYFSAVKTWEGNPIVGAMNPKPTFGTYLNAARDVMKTLQEEQQKSSTQPSSSPSSQPQPVPVEQPKTTRTKHEIEIEARKHKPGSDEWNRLKEEWYAAPK